MPLYCVLNNPSSTPPQSVPLSRPSCWGQTGSREHRLLLGTEDISDQATWHRLIGVVCDMHNPDSEVVIFVLPLSDHVRDCHWIDPTTALFSYGSTIASVRANSEFFYDKRDFNSPHQDSLRELAPNRSCIELFASGGFDKMLCVNDLTVSDCCIRNTDVESAISSLRWSSGTHELSLTTDLGGFYLYDARTNMRSPTLIVDTFNLNLYAHDAIGDRQVLLGFGDGKLTELDLRKGKLLDSRSSTEVGGSLLTSVGDISSRGGLILISGQQQTFSLWSRNRYSYELELLSSGMARVSSIDIKQAPSYVHAVWGPDSETIITADSLGFLTAHRLRCSKPFIL